MIARNLLTAAATVLFSIASLHALEVNVSLPGMLKSQIADPSAVTTLTVSGTVDATDLYFIGQQMDALQKVDLSNITIDAYNDVRLYGRTSYPANTIPDGCFAGSSVNTVVFPTFKGLIIGETAFLASELTSLDLTANIDSIGASAFAGCNNLTQVTLTACPTGNAVFADCTALTTVNVGNATAIAPEAFKGCTALTTVVGSNKLSVIGSRAFEGDTALTEFTFGKDLTEIGDAAFAATGLTEIDLAASTKLAKIPAEAFADAKLSEISLPDNVSEIGNGAFFGNSNITSITLPAETISLGEHALQSTQLTELAMPEQLEEIGAYALMGQKGIEKIVLPGTLLRIGDNAMEDMTGLKTINAVDLDTPPELGENVWAGVDQLNVKLIVKQYVDAEFKNADQWKEFDFDIISGVSDIENDITAPTGVKGRFVGTELQIQSEGPEIDVVRLYDLSGRLLITVEPRDTFAAVETSDFPGNVFIVNILLDDKNSASLKLAR